MKQYELSVLFHPDLEMNLAPALEKVKKLVESEGGKIVSEIADGKKRLAYGIDGQDFAVYYFFEVELPATAPREISRQLTIYDEVLRYLLVTSDEKKARYEAKLKAQAERGAKEKDTTSAQPAEATE